MGTRRQAGAARRLSRRLPDVALPAFARRRLLPLYGLIVCTSVAQATVVTLLPTITHEFSLAPLQAASVLSVAMLATLVVAIPIGLVAERVGAHVLTVAAATLIAGSLIIQAFAPNYELFLAGRFFFGIAFAAVWTAGLALLSDSTLRRSSAVGGAIALSGVGHLVGPPFAGYTAEHLGLAVPFVSVALGALVSAWLIGSAPPALVSARQPRVRLGQALRATREETLITGALVLIATLGLVAGIAQLVVPRQLDENGFSPGEIGLVLGAGAVTWSVVSSVTARLGQRAVRLEFAGGFLLAVAVAAAVLIVTSAPAAVIAFVVFHAAFASPLSTITYPLADAGARASKVPVATIMGLTNTAWATSAVLGPILAGALAEGLGSSWPFALVAVLCSVAALWALRRRRAPGRALEPAAPGRQPELTVRCRGASQTGP